VLRGGDRVAQGTFAVLFTVPALPRTLGDVPRLVRQK